MKKVAFIIDGSFGIGLEIVKNLIKNQYIVYNASRSECILKEVKNIRIDDNFELINYIDYIEEKRIDLLIYASNQNMPLPIECMTNDDIDYLTKSLINPLKIVKEFIPLIKKERGSQIVFISSFASLINIPYNTMYSMSKYLLNSLAYELNIELNRFGISSKSIIIGPIKSNYSIKRTYDKISNIKLSQRKLRNNFEIVNQYCDYQDCIDIYQQLDNTGMKQAKAGRLIYKIINHKINKKRKKVIYTIGLKNKFRFLTFKVLSNNIIFKLIKKKFKIKKD